MDRRILHIDMDAFFASVEQVRNPALRGKPLIVGGDKESRGVVCTASYEARPFGVRSGMSLAEARRRCPQAIFMRGNFEHYRAASREVHEILDTVSPLVEMASIDEAYVDVTGSQRLFGGDDAIAHYIKSEILRRTQLTCTVAIAPNKLVAKVAAGEAKPNGYCRVGAGEEAAYLRPLPLGKLPGAGPRTCEVLEGMGILTVGALADLPLPTLMAAFGSTGYALHEAALGRSTTPVVPESLPKSISRETTFEEDLSDWKRIERILIYLAERATYALREAAMETRCVTLKVRYADFQTSTFARTLPETTCLDGDIVCALEDLLPKAKERRARVRLIGVALTSLSFNQHQLNLFDRRAASKWERVLDSVDRVRDRHGFEVLRSAKSMELGRRVNLATPSLSR
jgi:DNA polymerase-4